MYSLPTYITKVDEAIAKITEGNLSLSDLIDFSDGEYSVSDLRENGVTPLGAAKLILRENGYYNPRW